MQAETGRPRQTEKVRETDKQRQTKTDTYTEPQIETKQDRPKERKREDVKTAEPSLRWGQSSLNRAVHSAHKDPPTVKDRRTTSIDGTTENPTDRLSTSSLRRPCLGSLRRCLVSLLAETLQWSLWCHSVTRVTVEMLAGSLRPWLRVRRSAPSNDRELIWAGISKTDRCTGRHSAIMQTAYLCPSRWRLYSSCFMCSCVSASGIVTNVLIDIGLFRLLCLLACQESVQFFCLGYALILCAWLKN